MDCGSCRRPLPDHARFCAYCGEAQPNAVARPHPWPLWISILLGAGSVAALVLAVGYGTLAATPGIMAAGGVSPAEGRPVAVFFAAWASLLVILQALAVPGLLRGRSWGRLSATAACALWSVTCVGAPLSLLVLWRLWRRPPAASVPPRPGKLGP